jgi:hypothetical protein
MLPKEFFSSRPGNYKYTKETSQKIWNPFFLWNRSISIWEALIHSMLICDVNNYEELCFEAIMVHLEKVTCNTILIKSGIFN